MPANISMCMLLALALFIAPASALADPETQQAFDALFGVKLKAAKGTVSTDDDLVVAKEMIAAIEGVREAPALVETLLDSAHQLAVRARDGNAVADDALVRLTAFPKRIDDALESLIQVRRKALGSATGAARQPAGEALMTAIRTLGRIQWKKGDTNAAIVQQRQAFAIARSIKHAKAQLYKSELDAIIQRATFAKRVELLQVRLLKKRSDTDAANRLARLFLTELDETDEAAALADVVSDPALKTITALLAKHDDALTDADVLQISKWYDTLTQSPQTRTLVTDRRALEYYQRYLSMHEENDVTRLAAAARVKSLEANMEATPSLATDFGIDPAACHTLLKARAAVAASAGHANFILRSANGMHLTVGELNEGARLANNRAYSWTDISESLAAQKFVRSNVRGNNFYIVVADRNTTVHLLTMEVPGTELPGQGWKLSKHTIKVRAKGATHGTVRAWTRELRKGEPVEIRPTGNYAYMLVFTGDHKIVGK